jgi:hypothetical protein
MGNSTRVTIAIQRAAGEAPRKITKIIGLNGGGFSVLAPYHKARSGFLAKLPYNYGKVGLTAVAWRESVSFTVDDRAKLTYHTDGFVQFSGERQGVITSGRDPVTDQPKGLGLFTAPLREPICTGPSVGVQFWGLDQFEELDDDEALVFAPDHFYYLGCTLASAKSWVLEAFVFPSDIMPPVKFDRGHGYIDVVTNSLNGSLRSVVRMSAVHLPSEQIYLGLVVNRLIVDFPQPSGWVLNGPSDFSPTNGRGHVLMGFYPRPEFPQATAGSLDRTSEVPIAAVSRGDDAGKVSG